MAVQWEQMWAVPTAASKVVCLAVPRAEDLADSRAATKAAWMAVRTAASRAVLTAGP